jgi:hypothetical protein
MLSQLMPGLAMTVAVTLGAIGQAPPKSEPDPEVIRLLRQTIAEQSRNPDRIIRTLEKELDTTNAPARPSSAKGRSERPSRPVEQPAPPSPPPVGGSNAAPADRQKKISDVESRLDEMMRARDARERAAGTNAPASPGQPPTKRARLDALLRQVVEGKLSDEQYRKERDRILAEPE